MKMTAGAEEHEPLITSSVDNQRVTYSNTPHVSYQVFSILFFIFGFNRKSRRNILSIFYFLVQNIIMYVCRNAVFFFVLLY